MKASLVHFLSLFAVSEQLFLAGVNGQEKEEDVKEYT